MGSRAYRTAAPRTHASHWNAGLTRLALALLASPAAYAQEQTLRFDLPSQPMPSALLEFGRQAKLSVLAPSELVEQKTAPEVRGDLSVSAALQLLLAGSGLRFEFVQPTAVRILRIDEALRTPAIETNQAAANGAERVFITGTNIRGIAPDSSPIEVFTAEDIEASGATTTEQFVAKLPQNLGSLSQYAAGATTGGANNDGVTSVDLRGLGVGTTLTLLNGRRIAPANSGQSVDVSLIPSSAIARVEVLTDGASAIYGSDAVGGVINFVLRDDFEGAETRASYGGVTSGNLRQGDFSQMFGRGWGSGHGLVSYNYHSASALLNEDRAFTQAAGPGKLTPDDQRHNLFGTLSQDIGDRINVAAQGGASVRNVKNEYSYFAGTANRSLNSYKSESQQYFGSLAIDYRITDDLTAQLVGSYSNLSVDGERVTYLINRVPVPAPVRVDFGAESSSYEVMAKLDGQLFSLPGGPVRFSVGAGVVGEEYAGINQLTNDQTGGTLSRRSPFAFGEVFVPLVRPSQRLPLAHRLELSLAARYTDYQDESDPPLNRDFGDSTDPKVGLLWAPVAPLALRATYGTSFRAAPLTQLDPTGAGHYLVPQEIGGAPSILLGLVGYATPDLGPETAETYTFGFTWRSEAIPGFQLTSTYYNIDYTDRIGVAPSGGLNPFTNPALVPDVVYRPPSAAFIEAQLRASTLAINLTDVDLTDPAAAAADMFARPNTWIYDVRYRNLATSKQDGFDIGASQTVAFPWGDLSLGANVTHILDYTQQASPNAALLTAVDVPGAPADWRGRLTAGLSSGKLRGSLNINYTDSYLNPWTTIPQRVDSWTTADLSLSYDLTGASGSGPRFSLGIQNLFDSDPPLMQRGTAGQALRSPVGFDPVNANPLGRLVTLGVTQKW